jgi:hypothetical protein
LPEVHSLFCGAAQLAPCHAACALLLPQHSACQEFERLVAAILPLSAAAYQPIGAGAAAAVTLAQCGSEFVAAGK